MSSDRDLSPGDPLGGGEGRREPEDAPYQAPRYVEPSPGTSSGYLSPPPPGAGGMRPVDQALPAGAQLVLAGWWRRVGAALIDGLIIGAVAVAIMVPLGIGLFTTDEDSTGFVATALAALVGVLVVAALTLLYAPIMMARTNGQTLGRMATSIRVVRTSGEPMSFGWAMLREVVVKTLLINGVAGSFTFGLASLLDVLWPLWDEENRALHDFVVKTRVVMS